MHVYSCGIWGWLADGEDPLVRLESPLHGGQSGALLWRSKDIFNMVFDAMIHHWVTLVVGEEAGLDGFGLATQWLSEFFYANGSLLALPSPARIQADLDIFTGLFDKIVLHTNVRKTVGMVYQTCHIVGGHPEVVYMRYMTSVGQSF